MMLSCMIRSVRPTDVPKKFNIELKTSVSRAPKMSGRHKGFKSDFHWQPFKNSRPLILSRINFKTKGVFRTSVDTWPISIPVYSWNSKFAPSLHHAFAVWLARSNGMTSSWSAWYIYTGTLGVSFESVPIVRWSRMGAIRLSVKKFFSFFTKSFPVRFTFWSPTTISPIQCSRVNCRAAFPAGVITDPT